MAEFLTMDEAKSKFGTKGRTNAGLTLGIIGTALAAFAGNNGGCGCGNGGGILGNLFGGNNNCCAMQAAENAKTLAMAQGQQADNLSWANRVQAMQQAQQAQQKTQPILDEINREVGSLSLDEQKVLAQMPEYQMAKQTYEAGLMSFLGTKFSQEFVSSADGKVAADNLLATIRKSKEHIHAQLKAKEDKVNTLLELVEQDPEIKKRLDEVMLSKSK
jgi:hypothetical protein